MYIFQWLNIAYISSSIYERVNPLASHNQSSDKEDPVYGRVQRNKLYTSNFS